MKIGNIIISADFRPQTIPGSVTVQWWEKAWNGIEQCCRGFDTYFQAIDFAKSIRPVNTPFCDHIPNFLRSPGATNDDDVQALMRLSAAGREAALSTMEADAARPSTHYG